MEGRHEKGMNAGPPLLLLGRHSSRAALVHTLSMAIPWNESWRSELYSLPPQAAADRDLIASLIKLMLYYRLNKIYC